MGMKERESVMNRYAVLHVLLLVGLVGLTVWAVICFGLPDDVEHHGHNGAGIFSAAVALMCGAGVFFTRQLEIDALATKHRDELANVSCARNMFVEDVMDLARVVYETREPTDANMRDIRKQLVGFAMRGLRAGAPVGFVTSIDLNRAVIRDVVQSRINSGQFDLSMGEKWVAELVQFALADKPEPKKPADKSAA